MYYFSPSHLYVFEYVQQAVTALIFTASNQWSNMRQLAEMLRIHLEINDRNGFMTEYFLIQKHQQIISDKSESALIDTLCEFTSTATRLSITLTRFPFQISLKHGSLLGNGKHNVFALRQSDRGKQALSVIIMQARIGQYFIVVGDQDVI